MKIVPVILCGGSGTRLWPVSRARHPKQLIALAGEESLLQQTVHRARQVAGETAPIVICNQSHRFQVAGQLNDIGVGDASILLEPCGRNTAPAIAVAAMQARAVGDDSIMLVLPSDHLIEGVEKFAEAVHAGLPYAETGALMTFGVRPTNPATGYGYIQADGEGVAPVVHFTEKPALELAEQYLRAGNYFWNSGMFMFRPDAYLDALDEFEPRMSVVCREAFEALERDSDFLRIPEPVFARCPADSIDYAVMEKTTKAMIVPLEAGWSDLGSWRSLWEVGQKDPSGNVLAGDIITHDVKDSYIRAESRLVAVLGLEAHVVVETADAVLVAHKDRVEEIKHLTEQLTAQRRAEVDSDSRLYFPWGVVESVSVDKRFNIRRLSIQPGAVAAPPVPVAGARLHLVVHGAADLKVDDECFELDARQAISVSVGDAYRLENRGRRTLDVLEISPGQ